MSHLGGISQGVGERAGRGAINPTMEKCASRIFKPLSEALERWENAHRAFLSRCQKHWDEITQPQRRSAFEMVLSPPSLLVRKREKVSVNQQCYKATKKQFLCCKRRPYTPPSGVIPPRSFIILLRTGNLAAHVVYRLMLLDPSPDMVHGSALRKTRSSTQDYELNSEEIDSQEGNPPLL